MNTWHIVANVRVDSAGRVDLLVDQLRRGLVVAIVHRLAIIGLGDLNDAYGRRGVFRGHWWERTEGEMGAVWRKMMREKSKRDRQRRRQ